SCPPGPLVPGLAAGKAPGRPGGPIATGGPGPGMAQGSPDPGTLGEALGLRSGSRNPGDGGPGAGQAALPALAASYGPPVARPLGSLFIGPHSPFPVPHLEGLAGAGR